MEQTLYRYFNAENLAKNSGKVVTGIEVLRTGKFIDSKGQSVKLTQARLEALAANFHKLRDAGILPNVPHRLNHGRSVNELAGYLTDLRVVGDRLVADAEFTSTTALQMFEEGTLRGRSAEFGSYVDNEGTVHKDVFLGFAWVDLPAVEGLEPLIAAAKGDTLDISELTLDDEEPDPIEDIKNFRKLTSAEMNDLPDAAFAYIEPGGSKDSSGKTTPRSLRHFPHHSADVKNGSDNSTVDMPHLRNAMARMGQGAEFSDKARAHLEAHAKALGVGEKKKTVKATKGKERTSMFNLKDIASFTLHDGSEVKDTALLELPKPEIFSMEVEGEDGNGKLEFANEHSLAAFRKMSDEVTLLRTYRDEQELAKRTAFVETLKEEGKILSSEENCKAELALVVGMTDEQFTAYSKLRSNQPPLIELGKKHGTGGGAGDEEAPVLVEKRKLLATYIETHGSKTTIAKLQKEISELEKKGSEK